MISTQTASVDFHLLSAVKICSHALTPEKHTTRGMQITAHKVCIMVQTSLMSQKKVSVNKTQT